ncbi:MAG: hypothetical protein ACK45F_08475, partial [bacterium]
MGHSRWILRRRLLERLPGEPGHVVWLRAPYGYGKTVLLRQWADRIRASGWRVVWVSAGPSSLRVQLGRTLGLGPAPSWRVLRARLSQQPTLLVLDDVTPTEVPDLRAPLDGLLLGLASRADLPWPELPKARSTGRLVLLTAEDLRFTLQEVQELLRDDRRAYEVWERTGGWPIAVHTAVLAGDLDFQAALVRGVRDSMGPEEWELLLLLSCVPALSGEQAARPLERLVESGFAQRTPAGVQLHALFAEVVHSSYLSEVQEVVRRRAPQLPAEAAAEAYLRCGLWTELDRLLDTPRALDLASETPSGVLRWCRALPGRGGPWRRLAHGMALCLSGRLKEAFARLETLARDTESSRPDVAVRAWGLIAYNAPEVDLELALRAVDLGWRLVDRVDPHAAARFLNWATWPLWKAGQLDRFRAALEEAQRRLPPDDPYLFHPIGYNLSFLRWQQEGALEQYLAYNRRTAEVQEAERSHNLPLTLLQTGRLFVLLGQRQEALACFQRAQARPGWNFWAEVLAGAWQAYLEGDRAAFQRLVSLPETQENPDLEDQVRGLWARTLREAGDPRGALAVAEPSRGFWTRVEAALSLAHLGRREQARGLLPPEPLDREERAIWHAARFRILRSQDDLDALVGLTSAGAAILPALVPVRELPRSRPEYADVYPVQEVLRSGWKEAIQRRTADVPPLEVELLGLFRVRRLGEEVALPPTARALLALMILGYEPEDAAEHLWPEADLERARNNLHVQMHHLRRALQPWGVPTYVTSRGLHNVRVDLWELEAAVDRGDADEVLRLYREPVAPGVDTHAVDQVRHVLHRRAVDLLFSRGREAPPERGIPLLERLLELEPLHAPALRALLQHLSAVGQQGRALRLSRSFVRRLKEDL